MALSDLLAASASKVKPGLSLCELQKIIDARFTRVHESQTKLDSLRANREIYIDQNTTNNPTLSM